MVGLARWTGRVQPRVSRSLAGTLDFLPTLAALAGAGLPTGRHYDGVDLSRVLLHADDGAGHSLLFHQDGEAHLLAMRLGDLKVWVQPHRPHTHAHIHAHTHTHTHIYNLLPEIIPR